MEYTSDAIDVLRATIGSQPAKRQAAWRSWLVQFDAGKFLECAAEWSPSASQAFQNACKFSNAVYGLLVADQQAKKDGRISFFSAPLTDAEAIAHAAAGTKPQYQPHIADGGRDAAMAGDFHDSED